MPTVERVRHLPLTDPGTADARSPWRFLGWLMKGQWHTLLVGMLFGIVCMVAQAVMPAVIGHAIDDGIAAKDVHGLLRWTLALLGIGLVQAFAGIMRHRFAVTNWLTAAYRTVQLVARQATDLGATLPKRVATGEVVAIGTNDLIQYALAVDRVNEKVAYLYEPTHPAILRLLKMVADAAHANQIWVGVCGELAGDPLAAVLLVGLGVRELSMAAPLIPEAKEGLREVTLADAVAAAERALDAPDASEARRLAAAVL